MTKDITNKTQPLYFTPWEDIEEGQEVLCFVHEFQERHRYRKGANGILEIYGYNGDNDWKPSLIEVHKARFLPAPQDRPKPNIWDEYTSSYGDIVLSTISTGTGSVVIKPSEVKANPEHFRAASAWFNHVLDGDEK